MKREEGTGIKAWELTDEMWEVAQPFIPERKRKEGRKNLSTETGRGKEASAATAGIGGKLFRIADRHSMEGAAEGIRGATQRP
jgi:hypothetical protein